MKLMKLLLINEDKVTEFFCIINEFCKVFSFMAENKPQKNAKRFGEMKRIC